MVGLVGKCTHAWLKGSQHRDAISLPIDPKIKSPTNTGGAITSTTCATQTRIQLSQKVDRLAVTRSVLLSSLRVHLVAAIACHSYVSDDVLLVTAGDQCNNFSDVTRLVQTHPALCTNGLSSIAVAQQNSHKVEMASSLHMEGAFRLASKATSCLSGHIDRAMAMHTSLQKPSHERDEPNWPPPTFCSRRETASHLRKARPRSFAENATNSMVSRKVSTTGERKNTQLACVEGSRKPLQQACLDHGPPQAFSQDTKQRTDQNTFEWIWKLCWVG
eukprot:982668-Amphidinium_carterae.1